MEKLTIADITREIEDDAINQMDPLSLRILVAAAEGRIDLNDIARRLLVFRGFPISWDVDAHA